MTHTTGKVGGRKCPLNTCIMKKKIIYVFAFGCLLMASSQSNAMECVGLNTSCGVKSVVCGDTIEEMVESAQEQDEFFCHPGLQ